MLALFASFYFVPAFFALLVLLVVWRIVRSFELSISALRIILVVLGTLAFAPMLVPAGTIMTAWVPHGLLLVNFDFGYYLHTAKYALPSFGITATIFGVVGFLSIRKKPSSLKIDSVTFALPVLVAAITFGAYKLAFPDRDIPEKISTATVEQAYGQKLDEVISLHSMSDPIVQQQAIDELKVYFENEPAVIHVSLEDPGYPHSVSGQLFYFYQDDLSPPSKSCSGAAPPEQKGLIRCSWKGGGASRRNVLKYTRRFEFEGERLSIIIEFDFKALMRTLPD